MLLQPTLEELKTTWNDSLREKLSYVCKYYKKTEKNVLKNVKKASYSREYLNTEELMQRSMSRSRDSMIGKLIEQTINSFADKIGYNDLPLDIIKKNGKDTQIEYDIPEKIIDIINQTIYQLNNWKKNERDEGKALLIKKTYENIQSLILNEYENLSKKRVKCTFDFLKISPQWKHNNKHIVYKELKFGGNIDEPRAKDARYDIFLKYAVLVCIYREEIKNKSCTIGVDFNIIEGDLVSSGGLRKFLSESEILCGNVFWQSLCNVDFNESAIKGFGDFMKCKEILDQKETSCKLIREKLQEI